MRIALIEPKAPGLHVFSKARLPRLGLPLIGTMLKEHGHEVQVFVEVIQGIDMNWAAAADVVMISTTTSTVQRAYALAERIRRQQPGTTLVMGGPHVSFQLDEALDYADYCVVGEGEHAAAALVAALDTGGDVAGIPGLAYRANGRIQRGPKVQPVDLDRLPAPDLRLIAGHEKMYVKPTATSRGCPWGCRFCSVIRMFGRGYRFRSLDAVMAELESLAPAKIFFYDDNFAADPLRLKQLLQEMIRRKLDIEWSAQVRADIGADQELLRLLKRAGATMLHIGFESVDQSTLDEYQKGLDLEEAAASIQAIHRHGMRIHGMFVIGADHDDASTPRRTVDFALKHGIDTIQLLMLTPLPGTPYFYDLQKDNRLITRDWQFYDGHHVVFQPAQMSAYAMQYQVMKEMARFYSLRHCIERLARLDLGSFYFRFYGWRIIKQWFADKGNQAYMAFLKEAYSRALILSGEQH